MAGAFGWQFIYFSVIFYLFLGLLMTLGAGKWMIGVSIAQNNTLAAGSYATNVTNADVNAGNYISYIWQNPFSGIAWLAWLSVAMLITDIYIIVTSLIP